MKLHNGKPMGFAVAEGGPDHEMRGTFIELRRACDQFLNSRGCVRNFNNRFGNGGFKKGARK